MKKVLSLFLTICLLMSVFSVNVLASTGDDQDETSITEETTEPSETEPEVSEQIIEAEPLDSEEEDVIETVPSEEEIVSEPTEEIIEEPASEPEVEPVLDWDGVTTVSVFENDFIRATFSLDNHWTGGYIATVTIENISAEPIENWCLFFEYAGRINSMWNASFEESEGGYILKNVGWNQDILPGQSITFGINGTEDFQKFPSNYKLLGTIGSVSTDSYSSSYTLYSDWGSGFSAEFSVTNTSDATIEDWILEFDFDRNITELWNGELISHEGNHYVVKNNGYNANIDVNGSIAIGFNGTDGSADDIPYNVGLRSSVMSSDPEITDEMIVDSVYGSLEIGFQNGDVALAVKNDVILPTYFEDVSVVWSSNNTAVIENDGTVNRLYDSSPVVTLTATISLNDVSVEKTFELRVIKTMYDDYSTDNIYIMDENDEVYFFNDDIDNTFVYQNAEGKLTRVIGSISDIIVDSPDEAMLAILGVEKLIGCESVYDELVIDHITKDEFGYTYVFSQVKNNVPVSGSSLTLSTDLEGNVNGFISNYMPITIETNPVIGSDAAIGLIHDCNEVIRTDLTIEFFEGTAKLVWITYYYDSEGQYYIATIDANDGTIISNSVQTGTGAVDKAKDENGDDKYAAFIFDDEDRIVFVDERYNLYVREFQTNGQDISDTTPVEYDVKNGWNPQAVSAFTNVCTSKSYYISRYSISSFDNSSSSYPTYILVGLRKENAYFNAYINGVNEPEYVLIFGQATGDHKSWGNNLTTVAHEYTHGVVFKLTQLNDYKNGPYMNSEAGAINEGYADVMSMIISKNSDWKVVQPDGTLSRDIGTPNSTSADEHIMWDYTKISKNYSDQDDYYDIRHKNSLILSHACYYMYKTGFSWDLLSKLTMKTLYLGYSSSATFEDVAYNYIQAASILGLSDYQKNIVKTAFEDCNVIGPNSQGGNQTVVKPKELTITGSVVKALPDQNSVYYEALDDAKVQIRKQGEGGDCLDPVYTDNGFFSFTGISYGKYVITVSKDGFHSVTRYIEIRNASNLTLDIICLISSVHSGYGSASGQVIDATTGGGVGYITLKLYEGSGVINSNKNNNRLVATTQTDATGNFKFDKIYCGQYTLEVEDTRPIPTENRYIRTAKNIIVFGDDIDTYYTISVSNKLSAGSMRIVLEWYSTPTDLDSHLKHTSDNKEIYWRNKTYYNAEGELCLVLDRDDVDGFGPETTTIIDSDISDYFVFYVHNYSNDKAISASGAKVSVYYGEAMYPKYVFYAPTDDDGRYWTIFKYVPDTKDFISINTITDFVINPPT